MSGHSMTSVQELLVLGLNLSTGRSGKADVLSAGSSKGKRYRHRGCKVAGGEGGGEGGHSVGAGVGVGGKGWG